MTENETRYTFDRVARLGISAVTVIAAVLLLRYLSDVLLPFAVAVILAYLLNPLVTVFERRTRRRGTAVAITLGGLGVLAAAVMAILLPLLATQVSRFGHDLDQLRTDLVASVGVALDQIDAAPDEPGGSGAVPGSEAEPGTPDAAAPNEHRADEAPGGKTLGVRELRLAWASFKANPGELGKRERFARLRADVAGTLVADYWDKAVVYVNSDEFHGLLVDLAKQAWAGGLTVVAFAVSFVLGLTGLFIVAIYLVFLLLDYREYARNWKGLLPPKYRESIVDFLEQFNDALRRYFRGQALVALCMGVLFSIGFTIIGLPMAVPIGLFIGLLNMVPYLQVVGLVPAMLMALLRCVESDASFVGSITWVLVIFVLCQVVQDAVLVPRLIGKATGLRPLSILLGVFIWGKLLGFLGLLLAIPLTCLGIAYYRKYVLEHAPAEDASAAQ